MGISALLADLVTPVAAFGALLFIASDAMIAIDKFHGHIPGGNQLIWITYYSAQLLILLGVESNHRRLQSANRADGSNVLKRITRFSMHGRSL